MSDEAVFDAIATLVGAGEYLDQIPGRSGEHTGAPGGSRRTGSVRRRVYSRGTADYDAARAAGLLERLPALRPASARVVSDAESRLGYPLPALLRRMYLEVGNGGFGPGYGILGVEGGHTDDTHKTAVDLLGADYLQAAATALLPLCHWGCAIYSLVDCATPDARMWGFDPNPAPEDVDALFPQDDTLNAWLSRWVSGQLSQPTLMQDPETGTWRSATDNEVRRMLEE